MQPGAAFADICPRPTHPTIHSRTLHRACLILGSVGRLSGHLGV